MEWGGSRGYCCERTVTFKETGRTKRMSRRRWTGHPRPASAPSSSDGPARSGQAAEQEKKASWPTSADPFRSASSGPSLIRRRMRISSSSHSRLVTGENNPTQQHWSICHFSFVLVDHRKWLSLLQSIPLCYFWGNSFNTVETVSSNIRSILQQLQ